MKRNCVFILIFVFFVCFVGINSVNADSPACHAEASGNDYAVGDEFVYYVGTLGAPGNASISGGFYTISYDPNILEPISINGNYGGTYNEWGIETEIVDNESTFYNYLLLNAFSTYNYDFYTSISSSTFVKLAYVKFKIKSISGGSTLLSILPKDETSREYYSHYILDESDERECFEAVNTIINLREKNDDTSLSSLVISNGNLSPSFDPDNSSYSATVDNDVSEIKIDGTCYGEKCVISGIGTKKLVVGNNEFTITVTAENGSKKNYNLVVTRREKTEVYLTNLVIENNKLYPIFDSSIHNYFMTVPYETDKLDITYISNSEKNDVMLDGNETLKVGENQITINLTSEDKTTSAIYNITVIRNNKIIEAKADSHTNTFAIVSLALFVISVIEMILIIKIKSKNKIN